ncbi:FKBP-type peptidyl-prolyl cis-trans isomerase [Aureispira anguillae]|uniref:peptidylprolyl isomerase n=1 Tax=Aureispira anguillae TaxID=2864201 RepID=A0A915YCA0_9BACT|nr:FKBP-type peptidyl-prolyl cis-trans isomerase [Aureispira anguillae]BDS10414.1 FKBP-type peptidyl-prolyl cis-trans isomerase [Aureispira anguillae]
MKTLSWLICFSASLLLTTSIFAQKPQETDKKQAIKDRSYAYGAMISKGVARMGLTKDEKNPDKFVEGLKKGMEGDKKAFQAAQSVLQTRMQSRTPSADADAAATIAYNLGVSAIGGLAVEVDIPASDFDLNVVKAAFKAAEAGESLKMEDAKMDEILKAYFTPKNEEYQKNVQAKKEAAAAVNIKAGKEFMAKNAKKKGVITMQNGMQYEIIKEGTGKKPTVADKVKTHYHGTLITGDVFDSSVERGEPIDFPLSGVIKGWQEGIPLMSEGATYRFYIPQELAYGLQSPSPKIPAGSTLIFEVELLEVNPGQKAVSNALVEGEAFLKENAKKDGVVTLPSGLQYLVIVKGSGPKPTLTDRVKVHYHGTLVNGNVFDSSVERGTPATFGVNQVIKGWQEGIPLMSVGSKYRLFIPANLAYGNRPMGAKIPAGSTLIFDVELFEINPK